MVENICCTADEKQRQKKRLRRDTAQDDRNIDEGIISYAGVQNAPSAREHPQSRRYIPPFPPGMLSYALDVCLNLTILLKQKPPCESQLPTIPALVTCPLFSIPTATL